MTSTTKAGVCAAMLALLLVAGCDYTVHPGMAPESPPASHPGTHTIPLPTPSTFVKRLSDQQASGGVSLPWHSLGAAPTPGRPFDATVDITICARFEGVHFASMGDSVEVAMVGAKLPEPCTLERLTAVVRVAWPSDIPGHGAITHAPTS